MKRLSVFIVLLLVATLALSACGTVTPPTAEQEYIAREVSAYIAQVNYEIASISELASKFNPEDVDDLLSGVNLDYDGIASIARLFNLGIGYDLAMKEGTDTTNYSGELIFNNGYAMGTLDKSLNGDAEDSYTAYAWFDSDAFFVASHTNQEDPALLINPIDQTDIDAFIAMGIEYIQTLAFSTLNIDLAIPSIVLPMPEARHFRPTNTAGKYKVSTSYISEVILKIADDLLSGSAMTQEDYDGFVDEIKDFDDNIKLECFVTVDGDRFVGFELTLTGKVGGDYEGDVLSFEMQHTANDFCGKITAVKDYEVVILDASWQIHSTEQSTTIDAMYTSDGHTVEVHADIVDSVVMKVTAQRYYYYQDIKMTNYYLDYNVDMGDLGIEQITIEFVVESSSGDILVAFNQAQMLSEIDVNLSLNMDTELTLSLDIVYDTEEIVLPESYLALTIPQE